MTAVLQELVHIVRETGNFNANAQVAPAAILWTDKESQWLSALSQLLQALPELFVFGAYDPARRTGPAIWLRCVIAGTLEEVAVPEGKVPVIYLPGVSRADLRAIEQSPDALKPLAELQFRGAVFGQMNGRDLTVNAFLTSGSIGLGLDVSKDTGTQKAMLAALPQLLSEPVSHLERRRLEASDFNALLSSDPVRDLLTWMNAPKSSREGWDSNHWNALRAEIKQSFSIDIERDGEITAAERLCAREGKWNQVWDRYSESPSQYPDLPDLLSRVQAPDLWADSEAYPAVNAGEENRLLQDLQKLTALSSDQVRAQLLELEGSHGQRRDWLWASLGQSPMAVLLGGLAEVAELTQSAFAGLTPEEMGEHYAENGWRVDAAVLNCLAGCQSGQQRKLAEDILHIVYQPWLADLNERFQKLVQTKGYPGHGEVSEAVAEYQADGEVVFFIDGLRLDVAHALVELLATANIVAELRTHWSALPSVTATAKAAVSPVHQHLVGEDSDKDFEPSVQGQGGLTHDRFKKLLAQQGWQYLGKDDTGDPQGLAWIACGDIDKEGHASELKLPGRIPGILDGVVERIQALMHSGWRRIRIVTDHGWLLVPGNMPKYDLPKQAAESRWGRCAQLKQGVKVDGLTLPWHWNTSTPIHYPPGIRSFIAGRAYAHGGVSLQECLVPVIRIVNDNQQVASASIQNIQWRGLVCKVTVEAAGEGLVLDMRTKVVDASTSLVNPHAIESNEIRLMVEDDSHEGLSASIVVVDAGGSVVAKASTTVGGDD